METRFVVKTTMNRRIMTDFVRSSEKRWVKVLLWVCVALFALAALFSWIDNEPEKIDYTAYCLLVLAFVLLRVPLRGLIVHRGYNHAVGELTYTFSDESMEGSSALNESKVQYDIFVNLAENKKYYYLYPQKRMAYVLPKADFVQGNPAEFGAFIAEKTGLEVKHVKG